MTKQPDSIDAKEEMKMATSSTGAADNVPRFDKFQLLVGEPSSESVEYSYVSNCSVSYNVILVLCIFIFGTRWAG